MVLAERIVWVHETLRIRSSGGLDIPEGVLGDGIKDLLGGCALEASREGVLKVTNEVVFLTVLENGEFLVEDGFKFLLSEW